MTSYYPSQAASAYGQPMYAQQPGYMAGSAYGVQPIGGVIGAQPVMAAAPMMATPMVQPVAGMAPGGYYSGYNGARLTFGQRMRMFFGLSPVPAFKYRSERNSWGFLGYSRRQRYVDPRTGGEVDRDGRPVIRV
ncbi:hypothetical protein FA15DRAFT_664868 [Coprinopsis marcescibilis]|uniref:Uncharacterized protein n=1 Tax=Coprinopsis marcescibilis TaxID=230819 RepID=A0A5C3L9X2_COPMA|nr:hypothetical protein FA15DRAFT_664868 [Coprinopsis marcescibilis]